MRVPDRSTEEFRYKISGMTGRVKAHQNDTDGRYLTVSSDSPRQFIYVPIEAVLDAIEALEGLELADAYDRRQTKNR